MTNEASEESKVLCNCLIRRLRYFTFNNAHPDK